MKDDKEMEKQVAEPKQSLKVKAYYYLKEKILCCEYAPGAFLNEQQLCEEMGGLSRTPMRDAIGRLEQEGFIKILPKRGLMVTQVRTEDIQHIYEVRLLVEPYALRMYGSTIADATLLRMRNNLLQEQQRSNASRSEICAEDDAFHEAMLSTLQNPYLRNAYAQIAALNSRLRVLSDQRSTHRVTQTITEHLAVIEACLRADYEGAAHAMEVHLRNARQVAFEVSKEVI